MEVKPNIHVMHIDDDSVYHPGGSNNYFVGDPHREMVLIDTGEQQKAWTQGILKLYEQLGRPKIRAILLTHGHGDHIGGLDRMYETMEAPVRCHPKLATRLQAIVGADVVEPLKSREIIELGENLHLHTLFTPGHEIDHIAFHLQEQQVLFTGDCVLGASSSTVRDLATYMKSLDTLLRLKHDTICPGHGPIVPPPRGATLVQTYIHHRQHREQQILGALEQGITEVKAIARAIYPKNLKKGLWPGAERNVRTHLEKLKKEGRIVEQPAQFVLAR
jgi:glyoxylase-like metal-dependent hydrolase (beta-lactamase superfamily II)